MNRITYLTSILTAAACVACVSSDQLRRNQYDADYRRALQDCGHPEAAYQAGYNAGYAGERMRNDWTTMCVPEVRAQTVAAYQDGFDKGASNAPIRVVHTVHTPTPFARTATSPEPQCTFDSDCGDGFHCRDHECMGEGYAGDRCVFNEDCTTDHCFGGTCGE
jgi:hypothetical protein